MVGKTLGQYEILERLGKGGSGAVYVAEDRKLGRRVALKVLKSALAGDETLLLSFKREAQALAALSHPGVVTVYSVEEIDGVSFLTMELIRGRSLRELLRRGGMRLDAFLDLAIPLADALAAAHEQGIVHRDLKPRNVMVTPDGKVKVVDFGLAKLKRGDAKESNDPTETLFRKGEIRGTIPYMSPEQVLGKPCGPPSDVFSLGTTFYMMLTGRRPFEGRNAMEIISRIVRLDPEPVSKFRPDLPQELVRIVRRSMVKSPERRYASAREVANALLDLRQHLEGEETTTVDRSTIPWLAADDSTTVITIPGSKRRVAAIAGVVVVALALAVGVAFRSQRAPGPVAGASPERVLMAVLPFARLGGAPEQDYLADGLTEETVTHLGRLDPERLGVIARTSVMRYKGTDDPVDEIARVLGVEYVLEGSVRPTAGRLHVNVKLIQAADQTQLWAESYDEPMSNIHALQASIGARVAAALAGHLLPDVTVDLDEPEAIDGAAYEAYLRGWHQWHQITPESVALAIDSFRGALEIEPDFAEAWSGLAAAYHVQGSADFVDDRLAYPASREAALRALELDPALAEAQALLASYYANHEWDWGAAERAFSRALELGPNSAFVHHRYALLLSSLGRFDTSLDHMRQAAELDPISPLTRWNLGLRLWLSGHRDEARSELESLPELAPGFGAQVVEGLVAILDQDWERAVERLEVASERQPEASRELLGYAYGRAGRLDEAAAILEAMEVQVEEGRYVPTIDRVAVHAASGRLDEAFRLLDEAYEARDDALVDLKSSLLLEPIRGDRRYLELLHRMGLPLDG